MKHLAWRMGMVCLVVFLSAAQGMSAITFDAASSGTAGAVSSIAWSHTVGSGSSRMLVVAVATESNPTDRNATSVSFGLQSLTKVPGSRAVQYSSSTHNATELWYLQDPTVGTASITITLDGALSNGAECGAVSLFGVKQAAPEAVAIANAAGSGGTYSLAITTLTAGAWLVDVVNNGTGGSSFTATATGMTEQWDRNGGGQMAAAGSTREVAAAGTVINTWTTAGTSRKAHSVAAFAPAPTGGNQPPSVTITTPTAGSALASGSTVAVGANASDDGSVANVDFYLDGTLLGSDTTSDYTAT